MLVYEKGTGENRHLYGTMNNIPSDTDNQLVYKDADGDVITPPLAGTYVDDGHGGILMKGEDGDTFVGVYIEKPDSDVVNIIPGGDYEPDVVVGIEFKQNPTKTEYSVGETLNLEGAIVVATHKSGKEEVIPLNYLTEYFSGSGDTTATADDTTITVEYDLGYDSFMAECSITVVPEQNNDD